MSKSLAYRWVIGLFLALFIGLQSHNIAHASEHIAAPEKHDCISCESTVLADDEQAITPTTAIIEISFSDITEAAYPQLASASYLVPQNRAPPPRAPPATK